MTEKGYKGGLVSRILNKPTGRKFMISTAQEIGKNYWTSNIFQTFLFGFIPNFTKSELTIVRNSKDEAHVVHSKLKELAANHQPEDWMMKAPKPLPPDGLSPDAKEVLKQ